MTLITLKVTIDIDDAYTNDPNFADLTPEEVALEELKWINNGWCASIVDTEVLTN